MLGSLSRAVTGFGRCGVAANAPMCHYSPSASSIVGARSTTMRDIDAMALNHRHGVLSEVVRFVGTTSPLSSSVDGGDDAIGTASDDKTAMIERWMRWNTSNNWNYTPNPDLISKIGGGSPLDQFRDLVPRAKREAEPVGRSWSAKELRRKSYDDLHKLWYVLYKEKNMLLTESNLARRHSYEMVQPDRRRKVQKSMGGIKQVLGERKRRKIADHRAYLREMERFEALMMSSSSLSSMTSQEGKCWTADEMEDEMDTEAENLIPKSEERAVEGKD